MKAPRYSGSRQKACQQCSASKAKCDRSESGSRCVRCTRRSLECIFPISPTTVGDAQQAAGAPSNAPADATVSLQTADTNIEKISTSINGREDIDVDSSLLHPSLRSPGAADVHMGGFESSHGIPMLDFSELGLTSSTNVENISNRWLRAFIPLPEQAIKEYPAAVQGFIHRMVKSYVSASIRGRCPPFVHSSQVAAHLIKPPLSTCLSLVRICDNLLPGSEQTAAQVLQREMINIHGQHRTYDAPTLLSAFQAYLILAMALFFRLRSASGTFLREAVMSLQDIACSSAKVGLVCEAEQKSHRPRWESWIIAESNRRTLYTMYLFDNILSANDGLPTFLGTELTGLPAPSNHALWRAQTRNTWEVAYNAFLAEWTEGLRIDELWPIPDDFDDTQINNRRDRVDHWLEGVDEFGTMIYAVTSCTHGG
ncbi:hypothetical protein GGR57DRAFT_102154 [Xylariaceae sp. FL1272]|nr:hypothetical protein GGR57DRAFT_102154 [Xylariaceae sp. FL1272]